MIWCYRLLVVLCLVDSKNKITHKVNMMNDEREPLKEKYPSLPLELTPKRKFTVWVDSSTFSRKGALGQAFEDNYLPKGGTGTDFFVFPTFDLYYTLPFSLASGSGFWNVSVDSFSMGTEIMYTSNADNQAYYQSNPCFNGVTINLEGSSPYVGFGQGQPNPAIRTDSISAFDRLLRSDPYRAYNLLPVGQANIFEPPSNLIKYQFFNASGGETVIDSLFATLPDTANITTSEMKTTMKTNKQNEIHVVLTSELKRQVADATGDIGKSNFDILKVPYLQLPFMKNQITGQFPTDVPVIVPFDRNYKMCLIFEEV